jgi:hypothetical protein
VLAIGVIESKAFGAGCDQHATSVTEPGVMKPSAPRVGDRPSDPWIVRESIDDRCFGSARSRNIEPLFCPGRVQPYTSAD